MAGKISERLFKLFDENPAISSKRAAELVSCPPGTAASTKNRKYDDLVSEVNGLRGYKKEVPKLEQELKEAKGEIERILKIHNDQVKSRKLTDAETLRKLAKL